MQPFLLLPAVLFIELVLCAGASARLGEDEIQCEDRYGFAQKQFVAGDKSSPLIAGNGTVTRTYLYQGWRIRIGFLDGIAVREEYWKVTGPGRPYTLANYETDAILSGEKGTCSWQPRGTNLNLNLSKIIADRIRGIVAGKVWVRSDGLATATLDMVHLSFDSLTAIEHDDAIKRANEQRQRAAVLAF